MKIFSFNCRLSEPRGGSVKSDDVSDSDRSEDIGDDGTSENAGKNRLVGAHAKNHICKFCGKKYHAENKLQQHIVTHGNWKRHLVDFHVLASILT